MAEPGRVPTSGLYFGLLGPLAVWRGGAELSAGPPQQRDLLALLILNRNQRVAIDALVDALWGDAVPTNALQAVRTYVSRLRQILGRDSSVALLTEPAGYRLSTGAGRVDVDRFLTLAAEGRRALLAGDCRRAERRLTVALRLFRGPPLVGLEHLELAHDEAERVNEVRLLADEDLIEAMLMQGRHQEILPRLRELVAREPYRERFSAQLMLALYRSGQQVEALDAYRRTRATLRDDLGLDPSHELQDLERMILLQERTLDHETVGRLHGVPLHSGRFLGRDGAVAELRRQVRGSRLVTVVGPAGVGKTRLAAESAMQLRRRFSGGVWWVSLESVGPSDVVSAIGRRLGVRDVATASPVDLVTARLRGERALVVLDNCDHVASDVGRFADEALSGTDTLRILATSREALRAAPEQVYNLAPFEVPAATASDTDILENVAVEMLVSRARAMGSRAEMRAELPRALREVVARLDGIPLAIELAAGKLAMVSAAELVSSLDRGLGLLRDGERTAPGRHQTLEAAIAWSYESLSPAEQRALRSLAVFSGSFDQVAAQAVTGGHGHATGEADVLPTLVSLVHKSLVTADVAATTRYRLLSVIRLFAREEASRHGELASAARRHCAYYAAVGERVAAHMLERGLGEWLRVGSIEHDNLRTALRFSIEEEDGETALQLASALAPFWFRIGHLREGLDLLDQALQIAGDASRWRGRGLLGRAWLADAAGSPGADAAARDALDATEPTSELHAFALAQAATRHIRHGRAESATALLMRAHRTFRRLGQAEGIALVEQLRGLGALRGGDVDRAVTHLTASRDRYRELRGDLDAGWTLVVLAQAALAKGDTELARSSASDALRDFRMRGDQRGVVASLACLGRARIAVGEPVPARMLLDEAVRLSQALGYTVEGADAERARSLIDLRQTHV